MRAVLAFLLGIAFVLNAFAQEAWPTRPIRFILPFPPGGGTDILGRLIAERLSASLGQPVVTENRGGAGGNVGAEAAAKSAPDGYTLVLVAPSLAISPTLYSKINYDPVKDFAPVSLVATVPNVMITQASLPVQTLDLAHSHERIAGREPREAWNFPQIEGVSPQLQLTGLYLREVQEVVDEGEEVLT